jgi:hypothetical protein
MYVLEDSTPRSKSAGYHSGAAAFRKPDVTPSGAEYLEFHFERRMQGLRSGTASYYTD